MFNWFRRQFSDQQQEEEQQVPEQETSEAEVESAEEEETAEDEYLQWAKAAYNNIQQRQGQPSATPTEETKKVEATPAEVEESVTEETVTEEIQEATTPVETEETVTPEPVAEETVTEAETPVSETVVEEDVTTPAETEETPEPVAETVTEETQEDTTSVEIEETVTPEATTEETSVAETATEEDVTTPVETEETVTPKPVAEETVTEAETPVSETVVETEETPEPVAETVTEDATTPAETEETPEPVAEVPETEAKPTPAWMKKTGGLERLKETAIEIEPEEEPQPVATTKPESEIAFDEEFIWSAQVLASQGRTPEDISAEEISWLKRLRQGLGKTRRSLVNQLKSIVGQGPLNKDAVMQIEELLLQADVGIEATDYIIETLQGKLREEALPPDEAIAYLKTILRDILDRPLEGAESPYFIPEKDKLNIWLMTGVNGAGKTTTIGKLAHLAQKSGYSCTIAAADTFRAAAVEQVKVWGQRSNTPVIANPGKNTDPAAVVFDAIAAAQSRNVELLLVDTAGRLQNKKNLMEELAKIRRIVDKKAPGAIVESLLVLDATLGQNGLRQAQVFSEAAKLSGVVLTKLDGTAKGGVALAVTQQLNLPIRFIGAGEGIEDLRPFSSYEFVEALLS